MAVCRYEMKSVATNFEENTHVKMWGFLFHPSLNISVSSIKISKNQNIQVHPLSQVEIWSHRGATFGKKSEFVSSLHQVMFL